MDLLIGWNSVCLVCLQEGELISIYEKDDKNMTISQKIMLCSSIVISEGMNIPEQICLSCNEDLNAAYRFRTNCESTNIIYKSTLATNYTDLEIPSKDGDIYKCRLPSGLNVKRIKVQPKEEPEIKLEKVEEDIEEIDIGHFEDDTYIITEVDHYDEDDEPLSELRKKNNDTAKESSDDAPMYGFDENLDQILEQADEEGHVVDLQIEKSSVQKSIKENTPIIRPVRKGRPRKTIKPALESNADVNDLVENLTTVTYVRKVAREDGKPMKICEICGNTYKYQHALESHMRRHRNERPFSCEFCDRAFVANVELRRHMRVHTGQKPYPCRHCSRRFSDFGSRIKHERTHTGERPYECTTCGKAFAYAHVLSVHALTHTGEKKFKCQICEKGFTKKAYLLGHMKRHSDVFQNPLTTSIKSAKPAKPPQSHGEDMTEMTEVEVYYES